jgi:hypothetical protein
MAEQRTPLVHLVQTTFPVLLPIAQFLITQATVEAAEVLKVVLKIYFSGINVRICCISGSICVC